MKILVTGRNGQVGGALQHALEGLGEIVTLDRSQLDLSNLDAMREVIRSIRPNLIVNAAAYTAVDLAETDEALAYRINAEAPGVMAEEAKRLGASLIHYSTDYVYDGGKSGAWLETDATGPLSAYGRSKLAGEQAIAAVGLPHLILRTSWVYGLHGKNFLLTMLRLAQSRPELSIVSDQIGAPTWSVTIAEATASIIKKFPDLAAVEHVSGIYHLCAGGQTSWFGFAEKIFAHSLIQQKPKLHPITTTDYPTPAVRPKNSVMNTDKFEQTFATLPTWDAALGNCLLRIPVEAPQLLKAN
jgi:dTDP-4-dehydrorhamnose reductase